MFDVHDKLPVCHDIKDAKVRTKDVILDEEVKFSSFLLEEPIHQGLAKCGFKFLSPIQNNALPLALTGKSVIVHAKSGTGKTLVYLLSALNLYLKSKPKCLFTLILAPTREIAKQVFDVCKNVSYFIEDLKVEYFIGGIPLDIDVIKCKTCHIAIGAPGRIKHLINLGELKVKGLQLLVLDEVDLLVNNKEFAIKDIISVLPVSRQTIVCTATYTDDIGALLEPISADLQYINMNEETAHESGASLTSNMLLGVKQYLLPVISDMSTVDGVRKRNTLVDVLKNVKYDQCFIFVNYISLVKSIHNFLVNNNLPAVYLSSEQNQSMRMANLNKLRLNESKILVTTDLAARGIDVHNANLVLNLGLPVPPDVYVHRMGRAGRYGSEGSVITIVHEGEELQMFKHLLSHVITEPVNLFILPREINSDTLNSSLGIINCVPERDNILVHEFIAKHAAKVGQSAKEGQSIGKQKTKKKKQRKRKTKIKLPEGRVSDNKCQSEGISKSSLQKKAPELDTTIFYSEKLEERLSVYADYFERRINSHRQSSIQPDALMELAKPKKSSDRRLVFTDYYQIPDVEEEHRASEDSVPVCESLLNLAKISRDENSFIDSQRMPLNSSELAQLLDNVKAMENGKNSSQILQLKRETLKILREGLMIATAMNDARSECSENSISLDISDELLKSESYGFSTSTDDLQEPPAKFKLIYPTRNESEAIQILPNDPALLPSTTWFTSKRFQLQSEQDNMRVPTAVNRNSYQNMSRPMLETVHKARRHERQTPVNNVRCPSCHHKFSLWQNSVNNGQQPNILASLTPFVSSEMEHKIYQSHFDFISRSIESGSRHS